MATGLQARQEIKLTQILPSAVDDKNTVCTNLGVYTGNSPRFALDSKAVLRALSQPSQQPVNCKTSEDLRLPDDTQFDFGGMGLLFNKAFFATFDDCVAKLPRMVEKIASRMTFEYQRFVVRAEWQPYTSVEDFGDSTAYVKWSAYDFLFNAPPNCTVDKTERASSQRTITSRPGSTSSTLKAKRSAPASWTTRTCCPIQTRLALSSQTAPLICSTERHGCDLCWICLKIGTRRCASLSSRFRLCSALQ
ncbi:hypothetical protein PINS_up005822 [Pythium insidiosum]|nr:hypothetical protein PINS_up005822 [Pythium insidiosum]